MPIRDCAARLLLSAFALSSLAQCSGAKSRSMDALLAITPAIPIVIDVDIPGDKPIKRAWFMFDVTIDNQTDQAFEIIAMEAEISATATSGEVVTSKVAWAPSSEDYSTDLITCKYSTYGTWDVGVVKKLAFYNAVSGCVVGDIRFFADGLPTGPTGKNYRYRVKIKPLGYFINDQGEPAERFDKFKFFFTQ